MEEKLDFKKILPIFIIVLIDLLGLTIIIPMMPLYAVSFGADPIMLGFLGAVYPASQFIGAPLLGRLSDKIGRRPVLLISQIGTLAGFLLLGTANSLWMIFLSRFVDGISGANISTAQAVISDVTSEKNRTKGMGLIGAAFGIGFIIGPVIAFAGLFFSGDNYHVPAFIAAAFSFCSIILTTVMLDETHPKDHTSSAGHRTMFSARQFVDALKKPQIGFLLALLFLQQIAFGGMEQFLSIFTLGILGVYASINAIIFVYVGFFIILVQGKMIGIWSRKWGDERPGAKRFGAAGDWLCHDCRDAAPGNSLVFESRGPGITGASAHIAGINAAFPPAGSAVAG
ncbi:MAG: MFS transporter [Ignavibacteriales bacterium]|nr:MFS transporter [Ignavibacteriales bacterium]